MSTVTLTKKAKSKIEGPAVGFIKDGRVYAAGQWLPVLLPHAAKEAGMESLTGEVRLCGESDLLAGYVADMQRAGCRWAVVPVDFAPEGRVLAVEVWRAGMETHAQFEKRQSEYLLQQARSRIAERLYTPAL